MGLFGKRKKMVNTPFGKLPEFTTEAELPSDVKTLRDMSLYYHMIRHEHKKAFILLKKVVELDHENKYSYSKFNLAKYYDGYYDEILAGHIYTDKKKANKLYLQYFHQSILEDEDLGTPLAYFLIKYPRSWNKAVDWLYERIQLDQQNHAEPYGLLGFWHLLSIWECKQELENQKRYDPTAIFTHYAKLGNAGAMYQAGKCYANILPNENFNKAYDWYQSAAKYHHFFGLKEMAFMEGNRVKDKEAQKRKEEYEKQANAILEKAKQVYMSYTREKMNEDIAKQEEKNKQRAIERENKHQQQLDQKMQEALKYNGVGKIIDLAKEWYQKAIDWLNNNVYDIHDPLYAYMTGVYFEEIGDKVKAEICLRNAIMFSTKNDNHVIDAGMKLGYYIDKAQLKDEDYLIDLIDLVYQYAEVEDNKISEYDNFIPDIINKLNQVYGSLNNMEVYYSQQSSTYQKSRILIFTRALQKLEQFFIDNGRKP